MNAARGAAEFRVYEICVADLVRVSLGAAEFRVYEICVADLVRVGLGAAEPDS